MSDSDASAWSNEVRRALQGYAEPLLRQVATRLLRPRNQWPVEELIDRCVAVMDNAPVIDRRIKELPAESRRLLTFIGHSRQPQWRLGSLLELLAGSGHAEGPAPALALLEAGLLFPAPVTTPPGVATNRLKTFEQWLGQGTVTGFGVFTHPAAAARAIGEDLGLPECPGAVPASSVGVRPAAQEADGLEWLLRMSVVWQRVTAASLRQTQQGDLFKRDLERLRDDPLLSSPPAEALAEAPNAALLAFSLARAEGLVKGQDGEFVADRSTRAVAKSLSAALASLFAALPTLETWNPIDGYAPQDAGASPYPAAYLLALLLLAKLPQDAWADPAAVGAWVLARHPYWSAEAVRPSRLTNWMPAFLLGVAYPMRWLQATKSTDGNWLVRLSPLGRWLLGFAAPPPETPTFAQTLLVQPNMEILAYRQGLTPGLIAQLGAFATWKSLGSACTLQLEPESVYRALESGETFESILQTLEQHGMRPTPPAVKDALRTWSNKRERISVYASATLLEFGSPEDLNDALARGLPGVRLSDRLAVVAKESAVDFRHFRLLGSRDYALPPERCVEVEADGVTLTLDAARSDLLLETELPAFAESLPRSSSNGRRQYRLTPASLAAGQAGGWSLPALQTWFEQRTGQGLPPAVHLLVSGADAPPAELRRRLVLEVATEELADGLVQWPETRTFVEHRLGPTTLAVAEEGAAALRAKLESLGLRFESTNSKHESP